MRFSLLLACLLPVAAPAWPVTFQWDETATNGFYQVPQVFDGRQKKPATADLAEGDYRLVGTGFDVQFVVKDGGVAFKKNSSPGVNLDRATRTFSFANATVEFVVNGFDPPFEVGGAARLDPRATQPQAFRLVCGHYKLSYGNNSTTLLLAADGQVELPDHPAGFSVQGQRVILTPREFTIEPDDAELRWNLRHAPPRQGAAQVKLLPGGYSLQARVKGEKETGVPFFVGADFLLASNLAGPFAEAVSLEVPARSGKAIAPFFISQPGGREAMQARRAQEAKEKQPYQAVLRESAAGWHRDFRFDDAMRIYSFPEELISYRVQFPGAQIRAEQLGLLALHDERARPQPCQLSEAVVEKGFLREATVSFRADLPMGASRFYRLAAGEARSDAPRPAPVLRVEKSGDREAVLGSDLLEIKVPAGAEMFAGGKPLAEVPAPVLGARRAGRGLGFAVGGKFVAPASVTVESLTTRVLETGPLFLKYLVSYALTQGRRYEVVITLRAGETHATVDETLAGFAPEDEAYFRLNFTAGLNPTRRQVMSNGGYEQYSGAFGQGKDGAGKLPLELGLNTPNSLGVMRAAAFWDESADTALLLSLYRLRDWQTAKRAVWSCRGPGNLQFFEKGESRFLLTRLEGRERHWAIALIPREQVVNAGITGRAGGGGGPEVRLWQKLSDFSLNLTKDRVVDWDEPLAPGPFADKQEVTFEEWQDRFGMDAQYWFLNAIVNYYWDYSAITGPPSFRGMPEWYGQYARSRAKWTPEQRRQVRAILLFMAASAEDDNNLPHHGMLGGHPNFVMDVKTTLPIACATFPNHPDAKRWRDSFVKYLDEWISTYQRNDDPEHHARGGRWTENIACYSGTALVGTLHCANALQRFDGTDLLAHPRVIEWVRWYRDSLMSPHEGVRLVPPQGAHSRSFEPGARHQHWDALFEIARRLSKTAPQLSAEMRWLETNGKEGTNPKLSSTLLTDYGAVLRHNFGGPHESYAHLQNISGPRNYRWTGAGVLYYGAKNKAWSYNASEDNGDEFSWDRVSGFSVEGMGLATGPTDRPLYDFGFAQFFRAMGSGKYRSRAVLLARDDYLVVADDVEGDAPGQFAWASVFELPQIYQLKPGAAATEQTSREAKARPGAPPSRTAHIRRYASRGDFLTVVAPAPVQAEARPLGALVNGDFVFYGTKPVQLDDGQVRFDGTAGYARPAQLALFEGSLLALDGLVLRRESGDFGVSAEWKDGEITGRIAGRTGGRVFVTLSPGVNALAARVVVADQPVAASVQEGLVTFEVSIALRDGVRAYRVTFAH